MVSDRTLGLTHAPTRHGSQATTRGVVGYHQSSSGSTVIDDASDRRTHLDEAESENGPHDGSLALRRVWSDADVAARWDVRDAPLISIGGGLASFALVDFLRISGLTTSDIRVITPSTSPGEQFETLCTASQLSDDDRLRSDSMSRIDNIWGFPSYAFTEARVERSLVPLWRVLTEPLLAEFFNPRVRTVLGAVRREADRIGWQEMVDPGKAQLLRQRDEGGYFVLVDPGEAGGVPHVWRARDVHLGLGHPSPRRLPDLMAHQQRFGDRSRMVNAYEEHDRVYRHLAQFGGRVIVRGSGVAASRILERLIEQRCDATPTEIIHLFRNYIDGSRGPARFRRPGGDGFAYQAFTFPKGAGGGQLRDRTLAAEGDERTTLVRAMGGTTTPLRRRWRRQLERGRQDGWYQTRTGTLLTNGFDEATGGLSVTIVASKGDEEALTVDWVIDATGLDAEVRSHPLIADLLAIGLAQANPIGRLDVDRVFEVQGATSGDGKLYASGASTLGGYLGPVDSFWGLTHAALCITENMAERSVCRPLGTGRSLRQWGRWARDVAP